MAVPSFPIDPADMQLFRSIDPGGAMARECWSDYSKKLALWRGNRAHFEQFCARWHSQHRAKLASLVRSPQMVRSMLARVGYMQIN